MTDEPERMSDEEIFEDCKDMTLRELYEDWQSARKAEKRLELDLKIVQRNLGAAAQKYDNLRLEFNEMVERNKAWGQRDDDIKLKLEKELAALKEKNEKLERDIDDFLKCHGYRQADLRRTGGAL